MEVFFSVDFGPQKSMFRRGHSCNEFERQNLETKVGFLLHGGDLNDIITVPSRDPANNCPDWIFSSEVTVFGYA